MINGLYKIVNNVTKEYIDLVTVRIESSDSGFIFKIEKESSGIWGSFRTTWKGTLLRINRNDLTFLVHTVDDFYYAAVDIDPSETSTDEDIEFRGQIDESTNALKLYDFDNKEMIILEKCMTDT